MTIASHHSQVCLDAFINCEHLLTEVARKGTRLSSHITKLLNECAHICMGTFHAIKNHSVNTWQLALLCMGICDECAEVCDSIEHSLFKQCAQVCRYCSDVMSELAGSRIEL
jgi:hypothetical protein